MMTTKATTAAATTATATTVMSMDASSMAPDRSLIIAIAILASIVVVIMLIVFISLVSYVVYRRKVAVRNVTALYEVPAEVIVDHFNMSNSPAYSIPDVMTQNSAYTVTADNETYEDVL